jgi:hypothetical protein
MLSLSKKKFTARTVLQLEGRPKLRSGEMKKAPVYKTGLHKKRRRFTKPAYKSKRR